MCFTSLPRSKTKVFKPFSVNSFAAQPPLIPEPMTIPTPVFGYFPVEPTRIVQFQPSKLQNRLDRIRSISEPQTEALKTPIETKHCHSMEVLPTCETSTISKVSQKQLDSIALNSLSKLTHDQRSHLVYISTVPAKYFQEVYEYFIDYYVNVQCVNLDFAAVETYLSSRGIEFAKIQPPKPFEHDNFSQVKIEGLEFLSQFKVTEEEAIQTVGIQEEFQFDQQVETMFNRRI